MAVAVSLSASPALATVMPPTGRGPERGIDVSAYQNANGPIDWRELARGGIKFVAIKASEDTYYTNPYYLPDARAASRAGLAVLAYTFANPDRAGGAAAASFAVRAAHYRRGRGTLPLVVDLENDPYANNDCYWFGQRRMIAWIAGFVTRARALTGSWPILYTTASWWQECTGSTGRFTRDPLWLADYNGERPAAPPPGRDGRSGSTARAATCPESAGPTSTSSSRPAGSRRSARPRTRSPGTAISAGPSTSQSTRSQKAPSSPRSTGTKPKRKAKRKRKQLLGYKSPVPPAFPPERLIGSAGDSAQASPRHRGYLAHPCDRRRSRDRGRGADRGEGIGRARGDHQPAVEGTDVSNLTTGTYNWPEVKAAGISFVGILAYDGASVSNPIYGSQVTGALGQGLYVMPYVVADPLKVATGTLQFTQHAWSAINGVSGAPYKKGGQYLPIVLDMESQPLVTSEACYGLNQTQMVTWIGQFVTAANKQTGLSTVIYSNPNWWQACTGNTTAFAGEPLWIADYGVSSPAIPPGWPGYTFWQSSDSGTVNGIPGGSADLDNMLGAPSTDTVSTTGSIQLQTLNSLAGQSVSYAPAGSLPSGFALSAAGKLTWSSAAVGTYSMGVTPTSTAATPATVIPSSLAVNLRVHGAITVANTARSSTVGTPVWFRVTTSGPDQNAGVNPTLKASGLPTGTSINSAGVITGWPTRYGTFKVTVSAADALGGTGASTFTWTVKAAAAAGTGRPDPPDRRQRQVPQRCVEHLR